MENSLRPTTSSSFHRQFLPLSIPLHGNCQVNGPFALEPSTVVWYSLRKRHAQRLEWWSAHRCPLVCFNACLLHPWSLTHHLAPFLPLKSWIYAMTSDGEPVMLIALRVYSSLSAHPLPRLASHLSGLSMGEFSASHLPFPVANTQCATGLSHRHRVKCAPRCCVIVLSNQLTHV